MGKPFFPTIHCQCRAPPVHSTYNKFGSYEHGMGNFKDFRGTIESIYPSPWELSKVEQDFTHGDWWNGFYGEAERVKRENEAREFLGAERTVEENEMHEMGTQTDDIRQPVFTPENTPEPEEQEPQGESPNHLKKIMDDVEEAYPAMVKELAQAFLGNHEQQQQYLNKLKRVDLDPFTVKLIWREAHAALNDAYPKHGRPPNKKNLISNLREKFNAFRRKHERD